MIKNNCTYVQDKSNIAMTVVEVTCYNFDSVNAKVELRNKISGTLYEEPRELKITREEFKNWRVR